MDNAHTSEIRNPKSKIRNPLSSWWRPILGTLLVLAGLATAILTLMARRIGAPELASTGAIASLVFVLLIMVLVVPPLARSAFAEVAGRGLPIEVTTGGVIFVVILVIVAFAAWNTGNNLLFMVFSIMLSTIFVSWAAARVALRDLTVSARFPDHIFAGETAEVIVTVRNAKRLLPSFSILVEMRGSFDRPSLKKKRRTRSRKITLGYFIYVPHQAAGEQSIEQVFPRRGHVLVNGFEISTRFPFGFFRHRRRLGARDVDIVVYPKPEPVTDELNLLPLHTGQMPSLRRGAGQDLLLLRDYQPRDDLRHIDWKATARSRHLTVREFTAEDERRITIVLDTRLTDDIDEENFRIRFESGLTQTASLVQHFIDERAEVCLVTGMERGRFGIGQEHLYACLRRLALVQPTLAPGPVSHLQEMLDNATRTEHRAEANYLVVLTTAARGSIPPNIWRRAFVIYL
ncbi:MAG TPA: DUF58 domain-containing protein [Pyrinomonadaceae bacterium]|nr:DUF58 domain-containing protein [Pyrinomonadaceae bacterium]